MGALLTSGENLSPALTDREHAIILIANDPIKRGDAAILLEGDGYHRVAEAVRLYREGWVEHVVVSGGVCQIERGNYPSEMFLPELIKLGVKEEHIVVEGRSQHTWDQAVEVLALARANGWRRILLVASHYHQFRAYLTFLKVILDNADDLEIINTPARQPPWFATTPWGIRWDLLEMEFRKIDAYRASGHVAGYADAIAYHRWKADRT